MRLIYRFTIPVTAFLVTSCMLAWAQPPQTPPAGQPAAPRVGFAGSATVDGSRAVANGGIKAAGWQGMIDDAEQKAGMTINDAMLAQEGASLHVITGPAVSYWKPDRTATGDYTVTATFMEPKYMNLNTHPHPYGIFIGGNDMGTPNQTELYCAAYGNGNFIVRGFGPDPFQVNGGRGEMNAAVHRAAGRGEPVSQQIALSVKAGKVECSINGTVVGSYDKTSLVTDGKLKSTDGTIGLRFAHNTEVMVSGFGILRGQIGPLIRGAGALFAQPSQLVPVPGVTVTVQRAPTGSAPTGFRQITITNSAKKTITAYVLAGAPANAPGNPPQQGGYGGSFFMHDAAVSTGDKPIEPGTTTKIPMPPSKDGSFAITAVVYADGSSVGDQTQLARIATQRKDISDNLKAVITDTQAAISAKTADDYAAIMSTKVNRITAASEAIRMPIYSTYGDLVRINQLYSGMAFKQVQNGILPKALDNFKKRLATLQQLVPGL